MDAPAPEPVSETETETETEVEFLKGDLLFVYGTLRKGEAADLSKGQSAWGVDYLATDEINGCLYHIGAYPGAKLESMPEFDPTKPAIVGEVFRTRDQSIIAILDAYEGYPYLYTRLQTMTRDGRLVWVYVYNPPVIPDQLIESGDWKKDPSMTSGMRVI